MADAGGILVLGAPNRVSLLSPVTFEAQINDLLEEGRVEEALSLAQVSFSQMDDDDPDLIAKVRAAALVGPRVSLISLARVHPLTRVRLFNTCVL